MNTYKHRARSLGSIFVIVGIIVLTLSNPVVGQEVAHGLAIANVLTGLSVVSVQDLDFGDVLQGVAKTVGNNDALNSGIFMISGLGGAGISVYISLPEYLATASGDDRMVVGFGATDCSVDSTGNIDPSAFGDGWPDVNPYNLPTSLVVGSAGPNITAIFLGGRVTPSVDQTSGPYSADITVTVAYTGT
ncbi:MAG: hypothetical protein AB1483_09825 [Candidatus Zixiibacteriota bacterium]